MRKFSRVVILLVAICLLVFCACSKDSGKKRTHKKDNPTTQMSINGKKYTYDDVFEKTNATEMTDSRFFNIECKRIQSDNKYNKALVFVYDSDVEATENYYNLVDRSLISVSTEGDNYSIGYEEGVCDASIKIMIFHVDNLILIMDVSISSDWAVDIDDGYVEPPHIYLSDSDIEDIVEEWL